MARIVRKRVARHPQTRASLPRGRFATRGPTIKMLALSFLVVVGVVLVAEGFGHTIPKGYIYFGMASSLAVEMLNIRLRKRSARAVHLHSPYEGGGPA